MKKDAVITKAERMAEDTRVRRLKELASTSQPQDDTVGAIRASAEDEMVDEPPAVVEVTEERRDEMPPSRTARFYTQMRKQLGGHGENGSEAASAYLELCFQRSVLPEPVVGKVLVSSGHDVDLSFMSMGNEVAKTLSKALPLLDPTNLALSNNGFSGTGVEAIATGLAEGCCRIESLDLSSNIVRGKGVDALCNALSRNEVRTRLRTLVLEHCGLGSQSIVRLVKALLPATSATTNSCSLRRLCLSRNSLDEPSASAVAKLAKCTESLRELGASWTNLRGAAAHILCRGLAVSMVETADLSWNAWYETPGDDLAVSGLAYMLSKSSSKLTHLDLSHSRIQSTDVVRLGKALESNRTLMGLHMTGNAGSCNASGFLRVRKQPRDKSAPVSSEDSHVFSRNLLKDSNEVGDSCEWHSSDNCWICERWVERRFCFTPGVSDHVRRTPDQLKRLAVSLRTSFDDFEAYPMKKKQGPGDDNSSKQPACFYEVWRMVPPGRHQYSFVVALGNRRRRLRVERESLAVDQPKAPFARPAVATSEGCARIEAALESAGLQSELNVIECLPRTTTLSASSVLARPRERQKKAWRVEQSVFAKYMVDTKALVAQAFDSDYEMTNLPKLLGDDEEEARCVGRDNYDVIMGAFRHFILSSTHQFYMGWNSFSEFVNATTLLDSKKLSRADIDTTFFTSCVFGASAAGPKKALTRFQFLDATFRLAIKRWGDPPSEAMRKMIEMLRSLTVVETAADVKTFHDRAWTEETDEIIRARLEMLTAVYEKYSGRDDNHGQQKQMSVGDWLEFLDKAGLSAEHGGILSEREAKQAFMRALQTVVDVTNITRDKQRKLTFVEFVEALLRIIDIIVSNPDRASRTSSSERRGSQIISLEGVGEDDNSTVQSSGFEYFPDALKIVIEERVSRAASNNEFSETENHST